MARTGGGTVAAIRGGVALSSDAPARPTASLRPPLQRSSLREQVAEALRDEMMAGRLPAGTHFTVKEIADLYGVSATPVREALVDLTAQDLLWMEHNRGFTVPRLSWADFVDIVEARTLVVDGVFRRPVSWKGKIDWERLPSLRRRADAAVRAARAGQLDVLVGCDLRFWAELAALVSNRRITDYLDRLRVQYWIFAAAQLRGRGDVAAHCWSGHQDLTDRLAARDRAGLYRLLIDHDRESLRKMAALCGESAVGSLAGYGDPPASPTSPAPVAPPGDTPPLPEGRLLPGPAVPLQRRTP